ncbi:MAG: hypothetical protein QM800_02500 [Paludibacter sp.]
MNRKLLVTLLRKDIQELDMITEGFMEMNEYPKAIISLAQRKADDIQSYIKQLAEIKAEHIVAEVVTPTEVEIQEIKSEPEITPITIIPEPIAEQIFEDKIEPAEDLNAQEESIEEVIEVIEEEETIELIDDIPEEQPIISEVVSIEKEAKPAAPEIRKTVLSERSASTTLSWNEAHSTTDNSIGATLANKKIEDIKQAINIGDRFRFQRELFKGNGEDMNKTLNYINQLATLVEVQAFLQSKYNWNEGNESAEDFYQIVRRRFI